MYIQTPPAWTAAACGAMLLFSSLEWSLSALAAVAVLCAALNFLLMGMPGMLFAYHSIPLLRLAYGRRALERLGGQNFVALGMGTGFLWPVVIFPVRLAVLRLLPAAPVLARVLACAACLAAGCLLLPVLLYPFCAKARR